MIQTGTVLKIVDNTGAKTALCLKVQLGYKKRYAFIGDIVLISIKSLRTKRRANLKVKKGELYKALILRIKYPTKIFTGDYFSNVYHPSAILLNKQKKIIGTRIFGSVSKTFRFTKYLKTLSLCSGVSY
jgi:large subunit ribosomal protein L14